MKCDELETEMWLDYGGEPMPCYPAKDVDEAIAELQANNKSALKAVSHWHDNYCELQKVVDRLQTKSECKEDKIRILKRALWLERANKAESEARGWYHSNAYIIKYDGLHNIKGVLYGKGFKRYPKEWMKLWIKIERLCLAKAEKYK